MPSGQLVYNAFSSDVALGMAVKRAGAQWAEQSLHALGEKIGSVDLQELAQTANKSLPVLHIHDRFGRRLDRVQYHPSYHQLMEQAYASKVHSLAWTNSGEGTHVARAALSYLWNQGENGIGCPTVMSYSIVPLLRANPDVTSHWEAGVLSEKYDPRHIPAAQKLGLTIAMSMTEKQDGSDLRANETKAERPATILNE
ncbi:MAG: hypothetical protein NVSMB34_05580 [Variovorax sp.]